MCSNGVAKLFFFFFFNLHLIQVFVVVVFLNYGEKYLILKLMIRWQLYITVVICIIK